MSGPLRLLTIDLEDWFHLLEHPAVTDSAGWGGLESRVVPATERLLERFEARGLKATFFTLGWIAERHPALIRKLVDLGHEVGCHSHLHTLIHQQTPAAFKEELHRALGTLGDLTGHPISLYRAPGFSATPETPWAFDALLEAGIRVDSSLFHGRRAHGGFEADLPAGPFHLQRAGGILLELPVLTRGLGPWRVPSAGGGYFRALPFPWLAWSCRREPYTMSYFHPRDFDADQPRLPGLSLLRHWRTYVGLGGALDKLDRLLAAFDWQSIAQALPRLEAAPLPVHRLD